MITDPEIRTPADYADAEPLTDVETGPSQQELEAVYSLADAARAAGAWSDEDG